MAYPAVTVPGVAYLDGTYYVMTPEGAIRGSDIDNPTSWPALNTISAIGETDGGVAIARHVNYVVAFGAFSIEFFYDAGNASGSPLARVDSAFQTIGCAAGRSVSQTQGTLFFIGVTRQRGRAVYALEGTNPKIISTTFVDRILDADDMTSVYGYVIKIEGHVFYVIQLGTLGVTLAYDVATGQWGEWTSLTAGTPLASTTVTTINAKSVLLTKAAHGLTVGQVVALSGSAYSDLNIAAYVETVPSSSTFTITTIEEVSVAAQTFTLTVTPYTEGIFIGNFYSYILGKDFLLDSAANLYEFQTSNTTDNGAPIKAFVRTQDFDGGSPVEKQQGRLDFMVSAAHGGSLYERHTDDDHVSYSTWRRAKILSNRTRLWRLGAFTDRAYEIAHLDPVAMHLQGLDVDVET